MLQFGSFDLHYKNILLAVSLCIVVELVADTLVFCYYALLSFFPVEEAGIKEKHFDSVWHFVTHITTWRNNLEIEPL